MKAVKALLLENNLPTADLSALQSRDFIYCGAAENPVGVIGLQVEGGVGLLRSLAVSQASRHQGCGSALVAAIENKAKQSAIDELYLLTETAQAFFTKLNYTKIPRKSAPTAIKSTPEFSGLCPDDAVLMFKYLKA